MRTQLSLIVLSIALLLCPPAFAGAPDSRSGLFAEISSSGGPISGNLSVSGYLDAISGGATKSRVGSTGLILSSDACVSWYNNADVAAGSLAQKFCYDSTTGRVYLIGNSADGTLETRGTGTNDAVVYNHNGVQGRTRAADEVPNVVVLKGQSAWGGAATNRTGANLELAPGDGTTQTTIGTYTNCAGKTVTVTIDYANTVLTEGVDWTAATSNAVTCTNLAAAITAISGVSATCSTATVILTKSITSRTLSIATNQASCDTVVNGTDGVIQTYGIFQILDPGNPTIKFVRAAGSVEAWFQGNSTDGSISLLGHTGGVYGTLQINLINGLTGSNYKWIVADGSITGTSSHVFGWSAQASNITSSPTRDSGLERESAGIVKATDGNGTLSYLRTKQVRATQATSATLSATAAHTWYDNTGATALDTLTLPSAAAGLVYEFFATDSDGIKVLAAGGAKIYATAGTSAVNGFIKSVVIGSYAKCVSDGTDWLCVNNGTWTVDL